VTGQRCAGPAAHCGGGANLRRPGPGRGHLGEQFVDLTLPAVLVEVEAYPFGLNDRLRRTEQDRSISLCVGGHLAHPLSPACGRPGRLPGQALIAVCSSLLAILMRRGLAFSATGMASRSTPLW
jgi:hypothetical protein